MAKFWINVKAWIGRRLDAVIIFVHRRTISYLKKERPRWISFKAGDWIIATRPGYTRDYMTTPLHIIKVTDAHIVYEINYGWGKNPLIQIMPQCELEERQFIIVEPALIEVAQARHCGS